MQDIANAALWYRRFGNPADVLALEREDARLRPPSAIRVRMLAAPVNPSDLIPITGAYRHRVLPPRVAGYEGVGVVTGAADGWRALVGRRVLPLRGPGTWQRQLDCDPALAVPVPDDIADAVAARGYINPLAAMRMLDCWPARGKRVLVTAGGSACAGHLAEWALDAGALEVVAVHRSPGHAAALSAIGARSIAMEHAEEIRSAAARADLVFDAVGGPLGSHILAAMRPDADFISYGLLSGRPIDIPERGVRPQRFHLRDQLAAVEPGEWQAWFGQLWPMLKRAPLPDIATFPLSEWREALAFFDVPGRREKPVLIFQ